MAARVTTVDWARGQAALRDEVQRVTALLRSVRDPGVPAVGQWSIAEVALHLSQTWLAIPGLARRDLSRVYQVMPELAGTAGDSLIKHMGELADMTVLGVRSDPERDLRVLADRIDALAEEYFSECAGQSAEELRPWIVEGVTMSLSTLTCHLLNETVIHGFDIARADGRKWKIDPSHAAIVLGQFVIPVMQGLDAKTLRDGDRAADLQATYDVRVRGGDRFYFIFEDGGLRIEEPSSRGVDCHISADPVALLLVFWDRQSQWQAIAKGKLLAWGRKPWLGPQLRLLLRNP